MQRIRQQKQTLDKPRIARNQHGRLSTSVRCAAEKPALAEFFFHQGDRPAQAFLVVNGAGG